ncbi:unnamed protein product, partial [Arabidopsis halleri]
MCKSYQIQCQDSNRHFEFANSQEKHTSWTYHLTYEQHMDVTMESRHT